MKFFLSVLASVGVFFYVQSSLTAPTIENEIANASDPKVQEFRASYAQRMKSYMNTSIDPCEDFYAYACGNYPNVIDDIELTIKQNSLYDLTHSTDAIIDEILQKPRLPTEKYYEELQKAKHFLNVCDSADIFPLKPGEEYLKVIKAIGGFPAVDQNWNASEFDWFNMTAHLVRYGVVGLVKEDIFGLYPYPPTYEIGKFGFGFDVYSDNIKTDESLGYVHNVAMMKRLLKIYGVEGTHADQVIEEIIEFWREALVFQKKAKNGCDDSGEEENVFSQWNLLFEITMNLKDTPKTHGMPCPCDSYFNQLNEIAKRRPKALANYMALKFLFEMHPQVKTAKHQHQHCLTLVKKGLPMLLTHFFIKEHFSREVLQDVKKMIAEIVKSFNDIVQSTDWLDDRTKYGIRDSLSMLTSTIGQVKHSISDVYIKETKKLHLTDNYDLNNLELAKFKVDLTKYVFLHSGSVDDATPMEILTAILPNGFYDNTQHTINILAGILFPPIYHRALPLPVKYGGLGFIIGHEVVHSLDPRGKQYQRYFKRIHAWSEKSKKSMKMNSQCFIEHHSNFTVPELNIKLDGKESLTETVCDSGGLRGSLSTLRRLLKEIGDEKQKDFEMPGLDRSPDETFFVAFAQVYCAKYEPKDYWSELYAGYPMDKYRVNLPLQNFDEFSKVFQCSTGSPMNPEKKCRMW